MMNTRNILLICGGGGSEHDISLISAQYIKSNLEQLDDFKVFYVEIQRDGSRKDENGDLLELRKDGFLYKHSDKSEHRLHFAIPCFHGPPGETGEIQAMFDMMGLPYLGCGPEASSLCFNKVSTKLWFDALKIPNTPYLFLDQMDEENIAQANSFFKKHQKVYVKASSQGSSIGCYFVEHEKDLIASIESAFKLSPYVLIENYIEGRELEIAVYQIDNKIIATNPGEIVCPNQFYDFDQKYSKESKALTYVEAKDITSENINTMKNLATKAFKSLKLRHLSRIDFFLCHDGAIYINEINTFPGMTPISMFPKMMENNEQSFKLFLKQIIDNNIRH
jgi:D-alanine-D-alanine ligase